MSKFSVLIIGSSPAEHLVSEDRDWFCFLDRRFRQEFNVIVPLSRCFLSLETLTVLGFSPETHSMIFLTFKIADFFFLL